MTGTRGVPMFSYASREEHLRQRANRGWTEDEDVLVCIVEIDRLNARIVALNAEVLDRMDQWHRDSLARDELARQQAAEIARLRAALASEDRP